MDEPIESLNEFQKLLDAVKQGDSVQEFKEDNIKEAIAWHEFMAGSDVYSAFAIAEYYEYVDINLDKSARYYEEAFERGDFESYEHLKRIRRVIKNRDRIGDIKDNFKIFDDLRVRIKDDDSIAKAILRNHFDKDGDAILEWAKTDEEIPHLMIRLIIDDYDDYDYDYDDSRHESYIIKRIFQHNIAEFYMILGITDSEYLYKIGTMVFEHNYDEGLEWFTKAANQGNEDAIAKILAVRNHEIEHDELYCKEDSKFNMILTIRQLREIKNKGD